MSPEDERWYKERAAWYDDLKRWYLNNKNLLTSYNGKWIGVYDLGKFLVQDTRKGVQTEALKLMPKGRGAIFVTQVGNEEKCIPVVHMSNLE